MDDAKESIIKRAALEWRQQPDATKRLVVELLSPGLPPEVKWSFNLPCKCVGVEEAVMILAAHLAGQATAGNNYKVCMYWEALNPHAHRWEFWRAQ